MRNHPRARTGNTRVVTFIYFFLLVYTIAQLVLWGLLLHEQSIQIAELKKQQIALQNPTNQNSPDYQLALKKILQEEKLRDWQYLGEGGTFLIIILVAAAFVYRAMRKQIRFSNQQHNFMMAVTHELKSPIAAAKLNTETLQKHRLDPEKQKKFLNNTLRELDRLNQLSNNMLLASQFESREYHMVKEKTDFSDLVMQVVQDFTQRMPAWLMEESIAPGLTVTGDELMLQIMISNLLENAAKYSPKNSLIRLDLSVAGPQIRLQVSDEGAGIPVGERQKIFGRFYRVGNEYTRKAKGTGLGLFLTKKIVEQHGGRIRVTDNQPKGSIFEITLPSTDS